ncbi:MAG TPA: hypothetical protein VJP02_26960 [Candidatus Sulfotelmatobacter sp.]|nr:hypothetical protein [Candidatus Sulfotelmatobacter sp.]
MSNTVTTYILVHDGGKLTVEDVNLAIYGEHPLPNVRGENFSMTSYDPKQEPNYYSATQAEGSEWIKVRTKWSAPVGAISQLAYQKGINLTMEFESLDNSEVGSMQFFYNRITLEGGVSLVDDHRPGAVPEEMLDRAKKFLRQEDEEVKAIFGVEEAE